MEREALLALCEKCGFEHFGGLEIATLEFLPAVRDMCAADKCRSYGRSWSCPPACGSLEELERRCRTFTSGVLVQSVGQREDEWDFQAIIRTEKEHKKRFAALTKELCDLGGRFMAMGAGCCTLCEKCTYPDAPCRFPERVFPSMEACGLLVSQVCKDNGMEYYYGKNSISFTSCVLMQP